MPLSLDNGLPSVTLRFGTSDNDEILFSCHLDTCAAMNTGNMLLHMWLMTKFPQIVVSFERCNDPTPFQPISLDCAIPLPDRDACMNRLTAVVVYRTRYSLSDGTPATVAFGLGDNTTVNAILGIPTLKNGVLWWI